MNRTVVLQEQNSTHVRGTFGQADLLEWIAL